MSFDIAELDHDTWQYALPKIRSTGKIQFQNIPGTLPFTGVRNPLTTSSVSHKSAFTCRTAANNWQAKVCAVESGAEAAVAMEALLSPEVHDVEFQPVKFDYEFPHGRKRTHTIDLRITYNTGLRRFVFIRNSDSLKALHVQEEIDVIYAAVPAHEADEFLVVDGDAYSRPRRENLARMHYLTCFQPDPEADAIVAKAMQEFRDFWHLSHICNRIDLDEDRIFQAANRLIGRGILGSDLDAVLCEHSRVWWLDHD